MIYSFDKFLTIYLTLNVLLKHLILLHLYNYFTILYYCFTHMHRTTEKNLLIDLCIPYHLCVRRKITKVH